MFIFTGREKCMSVATEDDLLLAQHWQPSEQSHAEGDSLSAQRWQNVACCH